METNLYLFGERLKEARKELGLSQADAADLSGITRVHWGRCERGDAMPGGEVLAALAAAGADVRYILTGSRDGPAPVALTEDERGLLADYREASGPVRRAARAALQSGAVASAPKPAPRTVVTIGTQHGSSYAVGDVNNSNGNFSLGDLFGGASPKPPKKGTPP